MRAITGGVDNHTDMHVAAVLDPIGGLLGVQEFPATAAGYASLLGCLGPDTAALLLVAAGDYPERLRSEAAWAHLCAAAPIPASSGKVTRHRLNPSEGMK